MKRAMFLTGDKQLDNTLRELPFTVQGRILRLGLREAMEPVLARAKSDMPQGTGRTAKRLTLRTTKPKPDGSRSIQMGIFSKAVATRRPTKKRRRKQGDKVPMRAAATMRIIEFGTTKLPGQFILRRALAAKQAECLTRLASILKRLIPIEAAAFHKKHNTRPSWE